MHPSQHRLFAAPKTLVRAVWAAWLVVSGASALHAAQAPSVPEYQVEMQEAWISMPDGVRLAADLYMPAGDVEGKAFPVILEYLPYRKTESRARNFSLYSYFVERGYVVARVDIRGTGNSEGRLIPYEYSDQEHDDGEVVIEWLSIQPWCNGNVGMFGISWGGFNAIQMAGRNPPALKAIIAVDATEDLYQDDVHFMDGIMHVDSWEMSQDLDNARPGAPDYVIDEAYFRDRFDTQPWMMTYKRQQRDGAFWDRASLRRRYQQIKIPTFHIGGWYDGYRDSLPRMLENLEAPVKAMIGPWSHAWPHDPYPNPGMEWRHEAVRWFDQWLKGVDTGIMDEPRFAVYVRQWHPPGPYLETAPGFWRWEEGWPVRAHRAAGDAPATQSHFVDADARRSGAPAALCSQHRHGSRRSGHVVGGRSPRPTWYRCLQPDLRQRNPVRGHRDPGAAPGRPRRWPRAPRGPTGSCACPMWPPTVPSPWWPAPASTAHTATRPAGPRTSSPDRSFPSISRCTSPRGSSRRATASVSR